jgi:hypothetical protein
MVMNPNNLINNTDRISSPIERPQVTTDLSENVILTTVDVFTTGRAYPACGRYYLGQLAVSSN